MRVIGEQRIPGTELRDYFTFDCGHRVPIYDIYDCHGLNQIVGYAKLINADYGRVYYRGEAHLHHCMQARIFRNCSQNARDRRLHNLHELVEKVKEDDRLSGELNISLLDSTTYNDYKSTVIESMLQHYGIKTRYIDIVDNHWVATWFGLYQQIDYKQNGHVYCTYEKREIPLFFSESDTSRECYQYIILLAIENSQHNYRGVFTSESGRTTLVDLRRSLPSTFLRPHAQHGLVVYKRPAGTDGISDLSENVVGILRLRIDLAEKLIGTGILLSYANLFPSKAHDHCYGILLSRQDEGTIFNCVDENIVEYTY